VTKIILFCFSYRRYVFFSWYFLFNGKKSRR